MPTATTSTTSTTSTSTDDAPPEARSTTELLAGAAAGDSSAWAEIVRRYSRVVSATVRSYRLQDADALDATQMTWLRLTENLHRLWYPERLASWLATTAGRECLRILRQTRYTVSPVEVLAANIPDPSVGPEQRAVEADTVRALRNLIARLPTLRGVLVRALFAEDAGSYADVARTVGIPVGSIGPSRARALKQLRWMVVEDGLGPGC